MVCVTRVLGLVAVISFASAKKSLYDFKLNDITGQPVNMADYKGKVKISFHFNELRQKFACHFNKKCY